MRVRIWCIDVYVITSLHHYVIVLRLRRHFVWRTIKADDRCPKWEEPVYYIVSLHQVLGQSTCLLVRFTGKGQRRQRKLGTLSATRVDPTACHGTCTSIIDVLLHGYRLLNTYHSPVSVRIKYILKQNLKVLSTYSWTPALNCNEKREYYIVFYLLPEFMLCCCSNDSGDRCFQCFIALSFIEKYC